MQEQDLLSESAAISYTGVSAATLLRFAEAGYFRIQDQAGEKKFSRRELSKIFGLDLKQQPLSQRIEVEKVIDEKIGATVEASPNAQDSDQSTTNQASDTLDPTNLDLTIKLNLAERELTTQRHLTELYEKLLTMREAEIADLKEQREWLRSRVEKLEDKSSRDQILLLSETQIIRKVLTERKRTAMTAALEWLGIKNPSNNSDGQTLIDVVSTKTAV